MTTHTLVRRGEGRNYDYSQDHCFVKLPSSATGGRLSMVEDELKPGFRLGRHYHREMTELFYVLEGEVEFTFDDSSARLKPGDTLTVPPNTWHAAECAGGGRMLTVFLGGRFDEYLERLSAMNADQFADAALMKDLAEEFDVFDA